MVAQVHPGLFSLRGPDPLSAQFPTARTKRPDLLPTLVALLGALTLGALLLVGLGQNPLQAYGVMLSGPPGSLKGLAQTASKTFPLVLVGLGIIVAFQARIFNISAEVQMVVGALAGTAIALAAPQAPGSVLLPLTLAAGITAGALWAGAAGFLKARFGVNEILSTVMLNQVAIYLMLYLLGGPMLDPAEIAAGTNIPQSASLPHQIWLPRIPRTTLHAGFLLLPLLAAAVYFLLKRTTLGFELDLDAYAAAEPAVGIRASLVESKESLSSRRSSLIRSANKVQFLQEAREMGYEVVLCFIGISNPEMSDDRVAMRVSQGGHDVPEEKLVQRFPRVLANLTRALRLLPHVLVFDNSDLRSPYRHIATVEHGRTTHEVEHLPDWHSSRG